MLVPMVVPRHKFQRPHAGFLDGIQLSLCLGAVVRDINEVKCSAYEIRLL